MNAAGFDAGLGGVMRADTEHVVGMDAGALVLADYELSARHGWAGAKKPARLRPIGKCSCEGWAAAIAGEWSDPKAPAILSRQPEDMRFRCVPAGPTRRRQARLEGAPR